MICIYCQHIDSQNKTLANAGFGHCKFDSSQVSRSLIYERDCKNFQAAPEAEKSKREAWRNKQFNQGDEMTDTTKERNEKVLKILLAEFQPIGPTEIARLINEKWCCDGYPSSAAISPILKRIGAVKVGNGKYIRPVAHV